MLTLSIVAATLLGASAPGAASREEAENRRKLVDFEATGRPQLGWSVAVDGDTAVLGDPLSGAVTVAGREEGEWTKREQLRPDDVEPNDAFGKAVAVAGDTLLVGAPGDELEGDGSPEQAGRVHVFERDDGSWERTGTWSAPEPVAQGHFGASAALDGDTAVVGAPGRTDDDHGGVHVLRRDGDGWSAEETLTGPDEDEGRPARLGASVDLDGGTLLAGAPAGDREATTDAGVARVFTREDGGWERGATLAAPQPEADQGVGRAVALDGDTAVVGACNLVDHGPPGAQAAHVFHRRDGSWEHASVLSSETEGTARFGAGVAVDGDAVLVGAAGFAHLHGRGDGSWPRRQRLTIRGVVWQERHGWAVALDEATALVGAYVYDLGAASDEGDDERAPEAAGEGDPEAAGEGDPEAAGEGGPEGVEQGDPERSEQGEASEEGSAE